MRKELIKLAVILGFLLSMYQVADAQVIVKARPVRPHKVIVKTAAPGKNYFWRDGHWKWKPAQKKYVWIQGRWVKTRRDKIWVKGHWNQVPAGYIWVPGHWRNK